jgi:hypothetical protein
LRNNKEESLLEGDKGRATTAPPSVDGLLRYILFFSTERGGIPNGMCFAEELPEDLEVLVEV